MSLTSSLIDRLKRQLNRREATISSNFAAVQKEEKAFESVDRGVSLVELDRIVGSVGRYHDFDRQFRVKSPVGDSERLQRVKQAMAAGKDFEPVALYQIKDDLFIFDGHHRVTAARELGRDTINARIVELLPSKESLENSLYLEQVEFRDRAGLLNSIRLTEPGQFPLLENQILEHQQFLEKETGSETPFQEAGRDWYRTIYQPLILIIRSSELVCAFPERTEDDLYLYISTHQWSSGNRQRYGIGIDKMIPKDMEEFRTMMSQRQQASYPEMQRQITFFILMNVDGKLERKILDKLMEINEVQEAHSIHGSVDILAKVVIQRDLLSSDAEQIAQFTHTHIRLIRGVQSTQTLIPGLSRDKGDAKSAAC